MHFGVLLEVCQIGQTDFTIHIDVPQFALGEPDLATIEIWRRHEIADHAMRHIKVKVVLAKLYLLPIVVKLCHAASTDDDEPMTIERQLTLWQRTEVLHDHKFVAVAQTEGVETVPWFKVLYFHTVLFLLSGCKIRQKVPNFAIQNFPKCALLPSLCSKTLQKGIFRERKNSTS